MDSEQNASGSSSGMINPFQSGFSVNQTAPNMWNVMQGFGTTVGNQPQQPAAPVTPTPAQPQQPAPNYAAWNSGTHYNPGQQVMYGGGLYTAQGDPNVWNENSRPDQTSNLWAYNGMDPSSNPMQGAYDANTHYMPGQQVAYNGKTYQAQGDPNVWNENSAPDITPQLWSQVPAQQPATQPAQPATPAAQPVSTGVRASFVGARPEAWQMTGKLAQGGIAGLLQGRRK